MTQSSTRASLVYSTTKDNRAELRNMLIRPLTKSSDAPESLSLCPPKTSVRAAMRIDFGSVFVVQEEILG